MSGDAVFPIPEPTFLFVNTLLLSRRTSTTISDRGVPTETFTVSSVRGYLTAYNPSVNDDAGTKLETVDAVALIPRSENVTSADRLRAEDMTVPVELRGNYVIEEARPNLSHHRLLLRRVQDPWTYP